MARRSPVAALLISLAVAGGNGGCGDDFTSEESAGGASAASSSESAGSGAAPGSGGAGGGSGASGGAVASATGAGGASGSGGRSSGCGVGEYVDSQTTECKKCNDFSDFELDTPEDVPIVGAGSAKAGARVQVTAGGELMVYTYGDVGDQYDIATAEPPYTTGIPLTAVNGPLDDAAELLLPPGVSFYDLPNPGAGSYLLLSSDADGSVLFGHLMGTTITTLLGPPFNDGLSNENLAYAFNDAFHKAWWMTSRTIDSAPYNGMVSYNTLTNTVSKVNFELPGGCMATNAASPWATPDGERLFFQASECGSMPLRIFWVPVDDTGDPTAQATKVEGLTTVAEEILGAAALSPDLCQLYFTAVGDNIEIRVAQRK